MNFPIYTPDQAHAQERGWALYVIECRDPATGALDFTDPQPEQVFGVGAIHGISEDCMARVVWSRAPHAVLTGSDIARWPQFIDPRWTARRKTW